MKVSYLCDARPGDVLDLHWDEVMDMGNYSEQNKIDTKQIYEGSSRDKQLFSGHRTENQELAYLRKVTITPSLAPLLAEKA
ncbi:hypothetical protein DNU24_12565 [Salmonella enterica subsp. salamae]|uniref:Integrase n=1 Tax=Salmonella enterica subsp. salamae TaxID=59202 RepID=A0A5Y3X9P7_SALER|nr:hypothetical protein [Salmonella enterica subsp. salamae]EDV4563303.1 hypothetical protein [Salmonella enterica subsp. enterica]